MKIGFRRVGSMRITILRNWLLLVLIVATQARGQTDDQDQTEPDIQIVVSPQLQMLREIDQQMRTIATRLDRADTSGQVQSLQLKILRQLDEMLAEANDTGGASATNTSQESGSESSGDVSQTDDTRPPADSESGGEGEGQSSSRDGPVRESMEATWGKLPARLQQQMRAAMSVDFLPKYEKLIEGYYKRLAEAKFDGS